jgi:hypothetical protein
MQFSIASRHCRRSSGSWCGATPPLAMMPVLVRLFLDLRSRPRLDGVGVGAARLRSAAAAAAAADDDDDGPTKDWRPSECVEAVGFVRGGGGSEWCERDGNGTVGFFPVRVAMPYGERGWLWRVAAAAAAEGFLRESEYERPIWSVSSSSESVDSVSMFGASFSSLRETMVLGVSERKETGERKREAMGRWSSDSIGES